MKLREKAGDEPLAGEAPPLVKSTAPELDAKPSPPPASPESELDEETQRYVTQALTDVDLFSSYGLTQKAIDLLETILERAPQHTPVLERRLAFSGGGGKESRTRECPATLAQ